MSRRFPWRDSTRLARLSSGGGARPECRRGDSPRLCAPGPPGPWSHGDRRPVWQQLGWARGNSPGRSDLQQRRRRPLLAQRPEGAPTARIVGCIAARASWRPLAGGRRSSATTVALQLACPQPGAWPVCRLAPEASGRNRRGEQAPPSLQRPPARLWPVGSPPPAVRLQHAPRHARMLKSLLQCLVQVLVVDDDPMCLKVVSAMLQRCHYEGEPRLPGERRGRVRSPGLYLALLPSLLRCCRCRCCHSCITRCCCWPLLIGCCCPAAALTACSGDAVQRRGRAASAARAPGPEPPV